MINLKAEVKISMTIGQFSQLGNEIVLIKKIIYVYQNLKDDPGFLIESIKAENFSYRNGFWRICNEKYQGVIKRVNYNSPMELCLFFENIESTADLIELLNEVVQNGLSDELIEKYFPMIQGDSLKSNFRIIVQGLHRRFLILRGFGFVFRAIGC